ncbi:cyclic nucleotide-binding domain-containing protein [Parabacteroides sp. 52]|uniref:Crp/Fnr family transcriptional regulator n=1 Tax=unclassified Parabacteroides TaxID=2649774 RepID=UPI0013D46B64|nr:MULTISPECIES: cyclic nucleotide-binding domain-containing protein [unclassified Parabacteroides]MDH6533621.1 CRP-like cAMP-binding protein [Parabacteroides sp. PM5-20]NDV54373.1 cyclic nucleotide-binding domain-containing protein [Parabacteroides sp. 52]
MRVVDPLFVQLLADMPEALVQDDAFLHDLHAYADVVTVKKGEYLLHTGELCQNAYFINKGVYINQFINEKGEEIIVGFSSDSFCPFLSAISYITEVPSEFEIKALEEGELIRFSRIHLEKLSQKYPLFTHYYQQALMAIITKLYTISALRQSCTAEEFMTYLYTNHITLINRAPDKCIARFMGISTSWYCKLKKRILN